MGHYAPVYFRLSWHSNRSLRGQAARKCLLHSYARYRRWSCHWELRTNIQSHTSATQRNNLCSPIIGGALTQAFGWRSTLYFIGAYCLSAWILILLFVPETCGKHNIDRCNSDEKPDRNRSSISSLRLLRALKLFAYPNVTLMCFVCGIL